MATEATTPPILQGPTAKEKKYDRQLRLWAASGQAALEDSHLLLLNSGSGVTGIETLKNLVLPGVGNFTIHDAATVQEEDLGVNFFLDEDSLGKSRAEETCKYLQELNPDVQGHFLTESADTFVLRQDAFTSYSHILIISPASPDILQAACNHAQITHKPIFYIHCVGFYSQFSIYLPPAFPIVDTHPDPVSTEDLRIVKPWAALSDFAATKTKNLECMAADDHGHVPYIPLLLHYIEEWKKAHEGKLPLAYREKSEFRSTVRAGMRTKNAEGGEENYEEAISAVLKSLAEPTANSAVKEIFDAPECQDLTSDSSNFWVIAHAISIFLKTTGALPLPGSIPDMKARSADYIALQNVYKSKAREDVQEVLATVRSLEKRLGRSQPVPEVEVEAFCKGAAHIKLVRGRPFHVIQSKDSFTWGESARAAANTLWDESSLVPLYNTFLAYDKFYTAHHRAPGSRGAEFDEDVASLAVIAKEVTTSLIAEAHLEEVDEEGIFSRLEQFCKEITRAGGGELHNIASLTGGIIAQEVIKVITKQYIPVDNTCLFDGVRSVSQVLKL